jgi:hypothetical protein
LGTEVEKSVGDWFVMTLIGLCIGTLTYLAWQVVALAVRHQLLGRSQA